MKVKNKRTNSYIRFITYMLIGAFCGGVIGAVMGAVHFMAGGTIESAAQSWMTQMQSLLLPILVVIFVLSILIGELNIHKLKEVGRYLLEAKDEECDAWEYEEEKVIAFTTNMNNLSQVLCVAFLSFGYSFRYIENLANQNYLYACLVFIACYAYDGILSVRMIKNVQKIHPEKKGDPSSRKFQKQWLESCDEAEREVIYQSSYKTYAVMNRCIPILLLITMLGNLFFATGMLAIIIVGVVWLIHTVIYTSSCVKLKGNKLSEMQ